MERFVAFCRSLKALVVAGVAGSTAAQAQVPADPDTAAWQAAIAVGTVAACQDYLEAFPTGRFVEDAFRCVIEGAPAPSIGLNPAPGAGPEALGGASGPY